MRLHILTSVTRARFLARGELSREKSGRGGKEEEGKKKESLPFPPRSLS